MRVTHPSSRRARGRSSHPCLVLGGVLAILSGLACARPALPSAAAVAGMPAGSQGDHGAPAELLPGVPNRPDVVTVVPFYYQDSTEEPHYVAMMHYLAVTLPVQVDGTHGMALLDTGDPDVSLNRDLLQPSPTGGVDSITTTNRLPDEGKDMPVFVHLRLGTLLDTDAVWPPEPGQRHATNAVLGHASPFWLFSHFPPHPVNLGIAGLEPFETIIDFPHRRVLFIRLDRGGHRLVEVPAYHAVATVPLVRRLWEKWRWGEAYHRGVLARIGGVVDTLLVDTGNYGNDNDVQAAHQLEHALSAGHTLFDLDSTTFDGLIGAPGVNHLPGRTLPLKLIGYPFLSHFGVVGFNFRTNQLILYRPAA